MVRKEKALTYSVYEEEDFERVYDEDDELTVRKGDLRALLDVATSSMDFGSGFLDNEQVEVLRKIAEVLDVDPTIVTPHNFVCVYNGKHSWQAPGLPAGTITSGLNGGEVPMTPGSWYSMWRCTLCRHAQINKPEDAE